MYPTTGLINRRLRANMELPDSIQDALNKKRRAQLWVYNVQEIETACKTGQAIVIRTRESWNYFLWAAIVIPPLFTLMILFAKEPVLTPDKKIVAIIIGNIGLIALYLAIHLFLNRDLQKSVFVVGREGIYARFKPFADRLTKSPGPKSRYRDMQFLLDNRFPASRRWVEKDFRWSEVAEVREELTMQLPYGKSTAFRWPVFPITDATNQAAEIREKLAVKFALRLVGRGTFWEISIIPKGGGPPICLYLDNYPANGTKDVESLFLLSYLVNYYWRHSKEQFK
jgi:hypothetical protein